jgi:hypothetical protein
MVFEMPIADGSRKTQGQRADNGDGGICQLYAPLYAFSLAGDPAGAQTGERDDALGASLPDCGEQIGPRRSLPKQGRHRAASHDGSKGRSLIGQDDVHRQLPRELGWRRARWCPWRQQDDCTASSSQYFSGPCPPRPGSGGAPAGRRAGPRRVPWRARRPASQRGPGLPRHLRPPIAPSPSVWGAFAGSAAGGAPPCQPPRHSCRRAPTAGACSARRPTLLRRWPA